MNNVFLKVAVGIFLTLLIIAVFPSIYEAIFGGKDTKTMNENVSVNLASFTENSVDRVSAQKKDAPEIVLEKSGEEWKIGSDLADKEKIATLFRAFSGLEIREMVSKNEDNFKKFGVTKDDGIRLAIREKNGKEHIFYVGNAGAIPQEFSLRKDGIKNTYSVKGTLRDFLTKDATYWKPSEEKKEEAGTEKDAKKESE